MKTLKLLFSSMLSLCGLVVLANTPVDHSTETSTTQTADHDGDLSPYMILAKQRVAQSETMWDYYVTNRSGFQQTMPPQFAFATRDNRFSITMGGQIQLRAVYGFDGIADNRDFVTYDIHVPQGYATQERFMMDASTSRFFVKSIINSDKLGRVVVYIDSDFRGGQEGSYVPQIRSAYVSMLGFTLGRDVSTFCDVSAGPSTIDYQGPGAYNFNFVDVLRYERVFFRDRMKFGVALETPGVSATYNDNFAEIPQRMPDIPIYLQYMWGENNNSHFRGSAVWRNMYSYDMTTDRTISTTGWGVQASGKMHLLSCFNVSFNAVYGEGITPYIQDLTGSGLDITPNPMNAHMIQATPMYGWQAAGQLWITPKLCVNGGYSRVVIEHENGYYTDDEYKSTNYMFGNAIYALTERFHLGAEYLYGTRRNMNDQRSHANRVNVLLSYNF